MMVQRALVMAGSSQACSGLGLMCRAVAMLVS